MFKKLLKDWPKGKDLGILIMRLVLGFFIFYGHGLKKWNRLLSGDEIRFADPLGIGEELSFYLVLFAEGICFLFVIIGLFTRLALIPLIIAMFVAGFVHHNVVNSLGDSELVLIYFFGFIGLFFTGAGKFSIDHLLKK